MMLMPPLSVGGVQVILTFVTREELISVVGAAIALGSVPAKVSIRGDGLLQPTSFIARYLYL